MLGGAGEAYSAGSRPDWVGNVQPPWNGLSDAPAIAMLARVFESVYGVTQATSVASLITRTVGNRGIAPKPTQSGMLQISQWGLIDEIDAGERRCFFHKKNVGNEGMRIG